MRDMLTAILCATLVALPPAHAPPARAVVIPSRPALLPLGVIQRAQWGSSGIILRPIFPLYQAGDNYLMYAEIHMEPPDGTPVDATYLWVAGRDAADIGDVSTGEGCLTYPRRSD